MLFGTVVLLWTHSIPTPVVPTHCFECGAPKQPLTAPLQQAALSLSTFPVQDVVQWGFFPTGRPLGPAVQAVVRSCILAVMLAIALLLPMFELVMGLIGAICSMAISVVFPCLVYLVLFWNSLGIGAKALNLGLIVVCSILGVLSAWASVQS